MVNKRWYGIWVSVALLGSLRAATPEWSSALLAQRAQKDKDFATLSTSPLAGVARFTLAAGEEKYLGWRDSRVVLEGTRTTDSKLLLAHRGASGFVWRRLDAAGQPPDVPLDGRVEWTLDRYTVVMAPSGERLIVQVFDARRPMVQHFKHLLYFPPDSAYHVVARLERLAAPEKIQIATSRGETKPFWCYAWLHFTLAGQSLRLMAFATTDPAVQSPHELFVPFADTSNDRQTYPTGRFMDVPLSGGETVTLDFNSCYNPLCNYSDVYNCPLPPAQNQLPVAILAGEKTYPH